jgi:hypothetical protein
MSQAKRASGGRRPSKAVSVLGIAGVSLAASSGGSPAGMPAESLAAPTISSAAATLWQNPGQLRIPTLDDEEISDVSLATFSLFDNESPGHLPSGIQLAAVRACGGGCGCGHGCGGCRGCGGVRACRVGGCGVGGCRVGGCGGCRVGGCGWGGCGGCGCGGCGWGWGWGGGCCLSWGGCSLWC